MLMFKTIMALVIVLGQAPAASAQKRDTCSVVQNNLRISSLGALGICTVVIEQDGASMIFSVQEKRVGDSLEKIISDTVNSAQVISRTTIRFEGQQAQKIIVGSSILVVFEKDEMIYKFALLNRDRSGAEQVFDSILRSIVRR